MIIQTPCFRSLELSQDYRTGEANIVRDFYERVLAGAKTYDRAVAFFTSDGLDVVARGLERFVDNDGYMRLVVSPVLTEADLAAIQRGLDARNNLIARKLLDVLADAEDRPAVVLLSWLVADQRLDIRVAIPSPRIRAYHEKIGVFSDTDGCRVAFQGSANETTGGLVSNFESIDVFFSWDATADRVARKQQHFERLWEDRTPELAVVEVPAAVRDRAIHIARGHPRPTSSARRAVTTSRLRRPASVSLRDYQSRAVETWWESSQKGLLSMATGTGKTKTALACAERWVSSAASNQVVVISVPLTHLVDQWAAECEAWGADVVRCRDSSRGWMREARRALDRVKAGVARTTCFITTLAALTRGPFLDLLPELERRPLMLICDEVHNLGPGTNALFSPRFSARLGLSATPERWHDEEGTEAILSYFGRVIFTFGISDAIDAGVLVPYSYYPVPVSLTGEELVEYGELMRQLARATQAPASSKGVAKLLARRSELLNRASGKLGALRDRLPDAAPKWCLHYCANREQLAAVVELLRDAARRPRAFTAEEDSTARRQLLEAFARADITDVVAMRALDEGADIPEAREAHILASSGNPREFIQRRGRVLRLATDKSSARIVDYVTVPRGREGSAFERQTILREMTRVLDFAQAAKNPDEARASIWQILDEHDLLHLIGERI